MRKEGGGKGAEEGAHKWVISGREAERRGNGDEGRVRGEDAAGKTFYARPGLPPFL